MPPEKEYVFENIYNKFISIKIKAYSFENAYEILMLVVKWPGDFKLVNNQINY